MTHTPTPDLAVIVVAAGSGTRLGSPTPKAFVPLAGRPLLEHALTAVFRMRQPAQVVVVAPKAHADEAQAIARRVAGPLAGLVSVVPGGATRQESVVGGLAALADGIRTVLVHDAARALTPPALLDAVAAAVTESGNGIVPGLTVVDTIKRVTGDGAVLGTVDRSELSAVQTPQGFPREVLDAANRAYSGPGDTTDDAAIVAAAGHPVSVIAGDPLAFKITTPWDLRRAELLLGDTASAAPSAPRVGTGLDVHAFADDDAPLWLAGLHWPGERGLAGHSDGDVAAHAICDALLSAAGLGDVGVIFGTDDPRLHGAHGDVFLSETARRVHEAGFRIGNVTVLIAGNRPKLAPRRAEAEQLLGAVLGAPVSVAATTTDALGFTGRGEGLAAIATALLMPAGGPDLSWGA
ncbi:2-C-methyl-D-erythritol 4-phosphate cytidylyltransferase [Cryobacterium tepidiphilum]|uniref:Bifunctional enzyme IspD/IspF n=1 Tax=Cryobacterium tepidiphilum TaxID=2486026 RepID=A0A3M8LF27_9MICO|nr:2-C-methyl-D-erythritol 4-phosphate cytidylyltransferase [Cryobacterium tepidiphilum]RNE64050.1 2-C-methyl-D-erythritol 4-phosphate cytidylyltransferase [Cryobacterium tepidiphilum]